MRLLTGLRERDRESICRQESPSLCTLQSAICQQTEDLKIRKVSANARKRRLKATSTVPVHNRDITPSHK